MKAKINAPLGYRCAPNGYTTEHFPCDTVVEGQVAIWAMQDGAAVKINDPRDTAKVQSPPETKRRRRKKAD